ncbi:MAG: transpeptidase family protein, partial [Acidobacteria bacterium]|nr:transpeptidase family protein [Acidobacteriota bacterium]
MRSAAAPSRTRIVVLGALASLWLGLIFARLIELQVVRHPELAGQARRQQQRTLEITPKRGVLYDRHRNELAVSISVESVFAVPTEVSDPAAAARTLASALALDPTELEDRLRSRRSFLWVKRKLDAAQAERVRALNLPGIYLQREHKRFYPKRHLAAHVLGFVGLDEDGLAGIEYSLDKLIRGRPQRLLVSADGRRRWFERRNDVPSEGASVALTLDQNIQFIAETELAAAIERTQASSGTILVQNPHTGELLALANYPTFNPNDPTAVPSPHHLNRALSLAYEPGSTFKVVTLAAALEEGVTDPLEVVDCQQGAIYIAGHRIRDHKPFGLLNLREVMYQSSDVGAIKVGLRLGNQKMYDHIRQWRFGQATGIELPAESAGLLRPASNWSRISIGAISMGQEVGITTLQLAAATSAIANGGTWIQPRIVAEIFRGAQLEPLHEPLRQRIISVRVAEELRRMLAGVVTQGTGRAAQPLGYSAAGKTGTAQKIDASGTYSRTDFIASFTGFAPVENPAVTVVVVLDSPRGPLYHGGEVAAPVFRAVVERVLAYLNVPPDLPVPPAPARPALERAAVRDFQPNPIEPGSWPDAPPEAVEPGLLTQPRPAGFVRAAGGEVSPPPPASAWSKPDAAAPGATVVVVNDTDTILVPDFVGQSLRAVGEQCTRLGLEAVMSGSGVVVSQRPVPGTRVPRGSRLWLHFQSALPRAPEQPM